MAPAALNNWNRTLSKGRSSDGRLKVSNDVGVKEADRTGYAVVELAMKIYLDTETKGWTPERLAKMAETAAHNAIVGKLKVPCAVRVGEFTASYPSPKAVKARKAREAEEVAGVAEAVSHG